MSVRRAAIAGAIIITAMFATSSALPASARLTPSAAVPSRVPAKTKKPLTKAQFITQANALCDAAHKAFVPVLQQFAGLKNTSPTPQQLAAFIAAFSGVVQTQITKTAALKPPKRDQSKVTKFLHENQNDLNRLKADPQLLASGHDPFSAADTLARAYGLKDAAGSATCANSTGQSGGGQGSSAPSPSTPTAT
jgi:hypothetical protein